jgi:hypothetical protein
MCAQPGRSPPFSDACGACGAGPVGGARDGEQGSQAGSTAPLADRWSADTPDPAQQRARECRGKVAHDNQVAAEQAAIEHEHRFGEAKSVYRCRFCGRWHVGTQR